MAFRVGDFVKFLYQGDPPFDGETITGEILAVDETHAFVYRDRKWRVADAIATWVPFNELERGNDD